MPVTVKQIKKGKVKTFRLDREQFTAYILNLIEKEKARKQAKADFDESEDKGD